VQWVETDRALDIADSTVVATWEGYVTLQIVPPRTADVIEDNPLGLRVTSVTWTRVASGAFPVASDTLGAATNSAAPSARGGTP
jgi:type IV secretion system protein VirB5